MDMETQIREALARGYCAPENTQKVLDVDLINAMTKEVLQSFQPIQTDRGYCYRAEHWQPTCDRCKYQEDGRHYCLLHSAQVKNMDIMRCDDFAWRDDDLRPQNVR